MYFIILVDLKRKIITQFMGSENIFSMIEQNFLS